MLVLSRKEGERIRIGDDIVITVNRLASDGKVLIGIDAPREVRVIRDELYWIDQRRIERAAGEVS